jgi:hypothetical protein
MMEPWTVMMRRRRRRTITGHYYRGDLSRGISRRSGRGKDAEG